MKELSFCLAMSSLVECSSTQLSSPISRNSNKNPAVWGVVKTDQLGSVVTAQLWHFGQPPALNKPDLQNFHPS